MVFLFLLNSLYFLSFSINLLLFFSPLKSTALNVQSKNGVNVCLSNINATPFICQISGESTPSNFLCSNQLSSFLNLLLWQSNIWQHRHCYTDYLRNALRVKSVHHKYSRAYMQGGHSPHPVATSEK